MFIFFFFSSRRRHTRCLSDWSSDVCSSDLGGALLRFRYGEHLEDDDRADQADQHRDHHLDQREAAGALQGRSEERRVGKECRTRWWPEQSKKKRKTETRRWQ